MPLKYPSLEFVPCRSLPFHPVHPGTWQSRPPHRWLGLDYYPSEHLRRRRYESIPPHRHRHHPCRSLRSRCCRRLRHFLWRKYHHRQQPFEPESESHLRPCHPRRDDSHPRPHHLPLQHHRRGRNSHRHRRPRPLIDRLAEGSHCSRRHSCHWRRYHRPPHDHHHRHRLRLDPDCRHRRHYRFDRY